MLCRKLDIHEGSRQRNQLRIPSFISYLCIRSTYASTTALIVASILPPVAYKHPHIPAQSAAPHRKSFAPNSIPRPSILHRRSFSSVATTIRRDGALNASPKRLVS